MASGQTQGPDTLRSRSAYVASLTKLYAAAERLIQAKGTSKEALELYEKFKKTFVKYIEAHDLALEQSAHPEESLIPSHQTNVKRHNDNCDILLGYIKETTTYSRPPSEAASHRSHKSTAAKSVVASHQSHKSLRSAKSKETRSSSRFSKSSSSRAAEARMEAELERKKLERLAQLKEMEKRQLEEEQELQRQKDELEQEEERRKREEEQRQQEEERRQKELERENARRKEQLERETALRMQQWNAELELAKQAHKVQELTDAAELFTKEQAREELGSDYESDEERENVTLKSSTKLSSSGDVTSALSQLAVRPKDPFRDTAPRNMLETPPDFMTFSNKTPAVSAVPSWGKEVPRAAQRPVVQAAQVQVPLNPRAQEFKSVSFSQEIDERRSGLSSFMDDATRDYLEKVCKAPPYQDFAPYASPRPGMRAPHNTPSGPKSHPMFAQTDGHHDTSSASGTPQYASQTQVPQVDPLPSSQAQAARAQPVPDSSEENLSGEQLLCLTLKEMRENQRNDQQFMFQALRETQAGPAAPQKFDGNPMHFMMFMANVKATIEYLISDPLVRLQRLQDRLEGDALKVVKTCIWAPDPAQGYKRAIEKLTKEFGRPSKIAKAFIDNLMHGPLLVANDTTALVDLHRDMELTEEVLVYLGFPNNLDATGTLEAILERLPEWILCKWKTKSDYIDEEQARIPTYHDLSEFIAYWARVESSQAGEHYNKVLKSRKRTGKQETPKSSKPKPATKTQVTTLSTSVDDPSPASNKAKKKQNAKSKQAEPADSSGSASKSDKPSCLNCEKTGHEIEACWAFKKLSNEDRVAAARKHRLCFRCLKQGHGSKQCDKTCSKCQRRHHVLLHDPSRDSKSEEATAEKTTAAAEVTSASTSLKSKPSSFGVLPVRVVAESTEIHTFALVDSGSNTTLVKRDLSDRLGAKGSPAPFTVNTLAGPSTHKEQLSCKLTLLSEDGQERVEVEALTVPSIPIKNDHQVKCEDWPHLKDLKLSTDSGPIELVIGTDCPEVFWSLEERRGGRKEPMARKTLLGWIVLGPTSSSQVTVLAAQSDPLQQQLDKIWSTDFQDTKLLDPIMSVDDKVAVKHMQDTAHIENGKWHVGIPWKMDPVKSLPNNRSMAESRLRMLKRKFEANPKLAQDYTSTLEGYIADNQARLCTAEEALQPHQWFLPHHAVFKPSNPGKARVVFDCAAEYKGVSLNDVIHQGPNFMNNLAGVLLRFRKEPVAVVGDIKLMFHQCFVLPEDQRFLRFLWWPNGDTSQPAKVYCMKVHLFGGKSSPSVVNFCMKKTAEDNESSFSDLAIDTLRRSFYVDDMIRAVESEAEAKQLITDMQKLLAKGGFKLMKFLSTSKEVINSIPEELRAKSLQEMCIEDTTLPQESALGLQWNVEGDFFTYTAKLNDKPATRRGLLATTASLYDPLGLVAPVLLVPKLVQQDLCRLQLDWDDAMPQEKAEVVSKWKSASAQLSNIKIPRCFQAGPSSHSDRELHVFSDASEFAYGAVAYLKVSSDSGTTVSLVLGKSRVAPIKTISIPRLELTAATVAAKMSRFIQEEMDFEDLPMYFWTDSMTALRYIRNVSSRFKAFVAHRVQQIQDLTEVSAWNYVPTDLNPADLASRGFSPDDETKLKFWLNGPDFLKQQTDYERLFEEPTGDQDLEVRTSCLAEKLMDLDSYICSFSNLHRLFKSVAWLTKFRKFLRHQQVTPNLTIQDLEDARLDLIKYVQEVHFADELECLSKGKPLLKSSPIRQLSPMIKDGLLCVGGRLSHASDDAVKFPVILPRHHLTTLIVRDIHERNVHVGTNHTLSVLRRDYYVLRGYSVVKSVVSDCVTCKKHHGKTMEQKMADLPAERVATADPPFLYVGVDYFGPMNVKFRRGSTKRYGCLFTCLVTRAIHIEIAHKLDSDSFLMALHRFMARRGKPSKIFSDNGSNFVAADKELADEIKQINSSKLADEMLVEAIEWSFNPPYAPHTGGAWERLIRSVKSVLRHLVQDRLLTDEELLSFMCEAEKVVNDRPLTRMGSDPSDPTPLTPSHLLLLRSNQCTSNTEANYVRRRWQVVQEIANRFYERFVSEYLPELQVRQKWQDKKDSLQVNDVVLVAEEDLPRGQWPLGIVQSVEKSADDLVRAATVKVKNSVKRRAINKLVLLERHDD